MDFTGKNRRSLWIRMVGKGFVGSSKGIEGIDR